MSWDLGEEVKFRRLLRRKVDQDILQFELAALRTLAPEDFFASRPYLVPEWVEHLREVDANMHKKLLRTLHSKYKSVMMRRRVQLLTNRESEWLMNQLREVFTRSAIITKKEITWLREQKKDTQQPSDLRYQQESLEKAGSQPGLELEQLSSLPSEIGCSSQKMNSDQDTNAELVMEAEGAPALPAQEQEVEHENEEMK